jgi:hypothetical protein
MQRQAPQPQSGAPKAPRLRSAVHRKNIHPAASRTLRLTEWPVSTRLNHFTAAPINDCCGEAMSLV